MGNTDRVTAGNLENSQACFFFLSFFLFSFFLSLQASSPCQGWLTNPGSEHPSMATPALYNPAQPPPPPSRSVEVRSCAEAKGPETQAFLEEFLPFLSSLLVTAVGVACFGAAYDGVCVRGPKPVELVDQNRRETI